MKLLDIVSSGPILVAEISANHSGDLARAKKLIKLASESGADLVKIQTYEPESMTIDGQQDHFKLKSGPWQGQTLYNLYDNAKTPFKWQSELFEYAKSQDIKLFSTPFDDAGVDLLESLGCPFYKLASFELTDLELVSKIARTQKDTIMSTGTASIEEVDAAVSTFQSLSSAELVLLHANSTYPSKLEECNLLSISFLQERYGLRVGFSDHTLGFEGPMLAAALGAVVVEKHFIDSRSNESPDSFFSSEPSEFLQIRKFIDLAASARGKGDFQRPDGEKLSRTYRRSLMYVADLPQGTILQSEHLGRFRPGGGLQISEIPSLLGRRLRRSVQRGDFISHSDFD